MAPAASPIVTFLRRPPIQSGTNEIFINPSNGFFPINENGPFFYRLISCSYSP
uniref:Uncharacterized protein n=1 Tax=Rhizophora mucronata TaxID=61149 RepID=A0A2P2NH32_RHIMU